MKHKSSVLVVLFFLFVFLGYGIYQYSIAIRNQGNVILVGIAAYQNAGCTVKLTNINWGNFSAGDNVNYTGYLRNEGNTNVTLNLYFGNWTPVNAGNFMNLTWNIMNGTLVYPNVVVPAILTLHSIYAPYPDINFTTFNFDTVIQAVA